MAKFNVEYVYRFKDKFTGPANRAATAAQKLNKAMGRAAVKGIKVGMAAIGASLVYSTKKAADFQDAMSDIRKVVDFPTPGGLEKMRKDIIRLSADIPLTAAEIAALTAAAAESGVPLNELAKFTRMAANAAVAFNMPAEQAGGALAKIRTALGMTTAETGEYADMLNHISNNMAATGGDLIAFQKHLGAIGEAAGFSRQEVTAFGAAMIAAGQGPDVAKTAMKALDRALNKGTDATGAAKKAFKSLGLDAGKVAKSMRKDALGTFKKVALAIRKLPEHARKGKISAIFGEEATALIPLINNFENLDKALELLSDKSKYLGSVQREAAAKSKTFWAQLKMMKNALDGLAISLGGKTLPGLTDFVQLVRDVAIVFSGGVTDDMKAAAAEAGHLGLAVGSIKTRAERVVASIRVVITKIKEFGSKTIAVLQSIGTKVKELGGKFRDLTGIELPKIDAAQFAAITAGLAGLSIAIGIVTRIFKPLVKVIGWAFKGIRMLGGAVGFFGRILLGLGSVIGTALAAITAPIWAIIAIVAALAVAIYHYWEPISEFVSGFASVIGKELAAAFDVLSGFGAKMASAVGEWATEKLIDIGAMFGFDEATIRASLAVAVNLHKAAFNSIIEFAKSMPSKIGDWFSDIFSIKQYSETANAEFRSAGENLARMMIDGIKSLPGKIVDLFKGLGAQIVAAIGSIDFAGVLPDWLRKKMNIPAKVVAETAGGVETARKLGGQIGDMVKPPRDRTRKSMEELAALLDTQRFQNIAPPPPPGTVTPVTPQTLKTAVDVAVKSEITLAPMAPMVVKIETQGAPTQTRKAPMSGSVSRGENMAHVGSSEIE